MPYPASLPFTALHFLLPSPRVLAAILTLGRFLLSSVNTPLYPTLLIIFIIIRLEKIRLYYKILEEEYI